jgi:hypothetical protein
MGLLLLFPRVLAAGRTRYWCSARRVEDAGEIVSRKDEMFHTHPIANRKRGPLSDPAVPTKRIKRPDDLRTEEHSCNRRIPRHSDHHSGRCLRHHPSSSSSSSSSDDRLVGGTNDTTPMQSFPPSDPKRTLRIIICPWSPPPPRRRRRLFRFVRERPCCYRAMEILCVMRSVSTRLCEVDMMLF